MTKVSKFKVMFGLLMATACVAPALAQNPSIDYFGYGWLGVTPVKNAGDELLFTGVADFADAVFGVDLGVEELTFYFYDLISDGDTMIGTTTKTTFSGGTLEIWRDGAMNADWGINPPNPAYLPTFTDGSLFFRGGFINFTMFLTAGGAGSFEGDLDGLAGEMIADVCTGCAYTVGGTFTSDTGAQIPEGYVYQMDGVFEIEATVSEQASSWGSVKAMFRD